MSDFEELELEKPIGDFIIGQTDIRPLVTANGYYYHYSDVCKLLNRLKKDYEKQASDSGSK
jgi:hypothetical protein